MYHGIMLHGWLLTGEFSTLERSKSDSKCLCSKQALVLVVTGEIGIEASEDLALYAHIALHLFGAVKRKSSVLHIEEVKSERIAFHIHRNAVSGIDIAGKAYTECGLVVVFLFADHLAYSADDLVVGINAGDVKLLSLKSYVAEGDLLVLYRELALAVCNRDKGRAADAGLVKSDAFKRSAVSVLGAACAGELRRLVAGAERIVICAEALYISGRDGTVQKDSLSEWSSYAHVPIGSTWQA